MKKNETGVRPLGKSVLVQISEGKEISDGGIFIPESTRMQTEQKEAVVIALGSGKIDGGKIHEFEVKPGDKVLVGRYTGMKIERNGEVYNVMNEGDILAILD